MTGLTPGNSAAADAPARRWAFGPAVLDERTLELAVNGEVVRVERKPLEVLLFLLHHAGEVVTKDEILEAVWPGRILSETVLTKSIAKVREALGDEDSRIIKTQHGYGYRLVAPVQVEASSAPPPPRFDFKPGDHPQGRPQWSLVERLGTGGHGEAWLARHDKTREARVYKFALDNTALASLKREITIYRLLLEALPERSDFVRILDWNLEDPPCFLEAEHAGLDLVQWAESQGGLASVPLAARLEIAAQIAEAVAAAHSVGVLHKDLKPSNVLVTGDPAAPRIKLADFGSGGVLDPDRLEALGITRLGFTTAIPTGTTSGTPIYFAPEVIAGQPFTVQSDVYALGVLLHQLVVGDLRKTLAAGWELDVAEELLRQDIAAAAAGDPRRRLADAAQVALRVRRLGERREALGAERQARQRALAAQEEQARAQQALERLRARRKWMLAALATLTLALGVIVILYARAERSAAIAMAVTEFLNEDLLSGALTVDATERDRQPLANVTLRQLLDRAARDVDQRFQSQPEAASRVHKAVADSYRGLGLSESARIEYERALALLESLHGAESPRTAEVRMQLAWIAYNQARYEDSYRIATAAIATLDRSFFVPREAALKARVMRAYFVRLTGRSREAEQEVRDILREIESARVVDPLMAAGARHVLARFLELRGEFREAEPLYRAVVGADFGPERDWAVLRTSARHSLGYVLAMTGRYPEADAELARALNEFREHLGDRHPDYLLVRALIGVLRLEEGRTREAIEILEEATRLAEQVHPEDLGKRLDYMYHLALAYQRAGRLPDAEGLLRRCVDMAERQLGQANVYRIALAEALLARGQPALGRAALEPIDERSRRDLPRFHRAAYLRIAGLLEHARGERYRARQALGESVALLESGLGSDHWRTRRVREELAGIEAGSRGSEVPGQSQVK